MNWDRKAAQVRENTREAIHQADNSFPMTRCGNSGWSPETVRPEAWQEDPLPWLRALDGQLVIAQAWERLTADDYTDEQRDVENERPAWTPPWVADRG